MSTFGTFLLVIAAFVGTVMFFVDPGVKLQKWARGKKSSDLKATINDKIENDLGGAVLSGCGFLVFLVISLGYSFIVEPLAVISAIVHKIGYQPVAYVMLTIVALSWIFTARVLMTNGKKKTAPITGTILNERGRAIRGEVVEIDEELKVGNPFWVTVRRYFFFLPDLYLWYLFLVVIGVIK